jgi:signal peptidase I
MSYLHSEILPDGAMEGGTGGKSRNFRRAALEFLETLLMAVVLFIIINAATARILVQSISMQPNLKEGDLVLVNRLVYKFKEPKRGEVIVFRNPLNPDDVPYIKRIIGLPGDAVRIDQGKVFVNGGLLTEPYLATTTQRGGEFIVSARELFVMGDNRNNSSDSRAWGNVPLEHVIGRAEAVYWPPQDWQVLNQFLAQAAKP